jgi:hypothetical protein
MGLLRTFFAGAFLGAGVFGAITHAPWALSALVPGVGLAAIELVGTIASGILAVWIVQHEGKRAAKA